MSVGASEDVVGSVAHHPRARFEAGERGLAGELHGGVDVQVIESGSDGTNPTSMVSDRSRVGRRSGDW